MIDWLIDEWIEEQQQLKNNIRRTIDWMIDWLIDEWTEEQQQMNKINNW